MLLDMINEHSMQQRYSNFTLFVYKSPQTTFSEESSHEEKTGINQ